MYKGFIWRARVVKVLKKFVVQDINAQVKNVMLGRVIYVIEEFMCLDDHDPFLGSLNK